mgnify:CR=1 FL=1
MVLMLHCVSAFKSYDALHTTVVYSCPQSVRFEYRAYYRTPEEVARIRHLTSGPRDDRMAVAVKKKRVAKKRKRR